jgi:hypothetical protein
VLLAVRRGHEHVDVAAEHLRGGVAKEPLGCRIECSTRPCASMTMMPSTAESMMARHRASLAIAN